MKRSGPTLPWVAPQNTNGRIATVSEASIRAAISNIVHFGDTDVLPFPLERSWFTGDTDEVVKLRTQ